METFSLPEILDQPLFHWSFVLFMGLCLGSFATALAYRLPRGESILKKTRSACPSCDMTLAVRDLVPFFSWAFLGGKCRGCKKPIGWRYPAIELATLTLCASFYLVFGLSWPVAILFFLAPVLVAIIAIDFEHKIIPDGLNLSIFLIGAAALLAASFQAGNPPEFFTEEGLEGLGGVLAYGLGSLLLRHVCGLILKREPMGMGDVKFFAAIGFWLGLNPETAAWLMVAAGLTGVVLALLWKKARGEAEFPFGPALVLAFIGALLWQKPQFFPI